MKVLRINVDVLIAPELISSYEVHESGFTDYVVVNAYPVNGGRAIQLDRFKINAENGWTKGAWTLARAELARIQALVEEL